MSSPETQRLVNAQPQQTNVDVGTPSARSSRAYKVAGITVLACVLIMGQAAIAYFVVSQGGEIRALQQQHNDMRSLLTKSRSVSVPMRMQMPINSLTADFLDEDSSPETTKKVSVPMRMQMPINSLAADFKVEDSSAETAKKGVVPLTPCQLESGGVKPMQVPSFRPACDKDGLYKAQQCFANECWCVNPSTGEQIPGSTAIGQAKCGPTDAVTTPRVSDDN